MNDNDSRRPPEISELTRLLPAPGGRDLPEGRRQLLKDHLMSELRRPEAAIRPPAPGRRRKRPHRLAAVAAAGVLAIAVAVGADALGAHAKPAARPSGQARNGTPATATQLLDKIANVAARQASPAVSDGEFMYIRSEVAYTDYTITNGHETSTMQKLHERQIWLPVANICATGLLIEDGSRIPISPFPVSNGKVDRSPQSRPRPDFTCPSEGNLGDPTYRLLQSLPTKPAALLKVLDAAKKVTNDDAVGTIGGLIQETIIPPPVAAALYRVAARLPGATLIPNATNADGQHGIGIAWTSTNGKNEYRDEWIFNKTTLQYIGERDYNVNTGAVTGESAILQRAFVDKAGQLPPNG